MIPLFRKGGEIPEDRIRRTNFRIRPGKIRLVKVRQVARERRRSGRVFPERRGPGPLPFGEAGNGNLGRGVVQDRHDGPRHENPRAVNQVRSGTPVAMNLRNDPRNADTQEILEVRRR